MRSLNQYLVSRNGHWHYVRRVPDAVAAHDTRVYSKGTLKTTSLEIARVRRDAMAEADDIYWTSLLEREGLVKPSAASVPMRRYRAAKKRALARGFIYTPVSELAETVGIEELLDRITQIQRAPVAEKAEAEAMLGTVEAVHPKLSEAFDLYCGKLAISDLVGKSDEQKASWRKVKQRAVNNFIAVCADLPMDKITRKHAQKFREWWGERINPKDGKKGLNPNSANRDIGNMGSLFQAFWDYEGQADRQNPFDKMRFTGTVYKDIPPFSTEWVQSKILISNAFEGLNPEAALIFLAMIETGCRPSEISNLTPENLVLDHEIPHLNLKNRKDRKLKSRSSVRQIPLLGVSLEALKRAQNGFPRYRDKGSSLSATLLKYFRSNGLMPSKDHRIYSIRHSLEKRMLEADLDYGLRCLLMGHHDRRPQYGDGGSLEFRRDQLMKIIYPFPDDLFAKIDTRLSS